MLTSTLASLPALAPAVWHGPPIGFGWLFFVMPLFWLIVIGLVVFFITRRRRHSFGGGEPTASAERTLAERFAQGDIDETEYRARLEVLRTNRAGG